MRVPSGYVHKEIVRPALDALDRPGFEGALDEFKTALVHARDGKTKEAATEATKALESTMKCICTARGLAYPAGATAKPLFDLLADKDLIPPWMESGLMGTSRNTKQKQRPWAGSRAEGAPVSHG